MATEPMDLVELIMNETRLVLKEMKSTKDLEQLKIQSEIVKNLCGSVGKLFGTVSDAMLAGDQAGMFDDDDEA